VLLLKFSKKQHLKVKIHPLGENAPNLFTLNATRHPNDKVGPGLSENMASTISQFNFLLVFLDTNYSREKKVKCQIIKS
jgi:hypothetical protein